MNAFCDQRKSALTMPANAGQHAQPRRRLVCQHGGRAAEASRNEPAGTGGGPWAGAELLARMIETGQRRLDLIEWIQILRTVGADPEKEIVNLIRQVSPLVTKAKKRS
jgi:hypothetical protein